MHNWIHSDFIYINDIIDDNGKIAKDKIFRKLRNTKNWIAEISKVKNSIPTSWLKALTTEESIKSKVYFNRSFININKENIEIENLSNKNVYQLLVQKKISPNIGINKWKNEG